MNEENRIDSTLSRRQFVKLLSKLSLAALTVIKIPILSAQNIFYSKPGASCSYIESILNDKQKKIIEKIINGLTPANIRKAIQDDDPNYNVVDKFEQFAFPNGEEYIANIKFLIFGIDQLSFLCTKKRLVNSTEDEVFNFFTQILRDGKLQNWQLKILKSPLVPDPRKTLRNIFMGLKIIALQPIFVNQKVVWEKIQYPGPWLKDINKKNEYYKLSTSFRESIEIEKGMNALREAVIPHSEIEKKYRGDVQIIKDGYILKTDVLVVGSGSGGGIVAKEIAEQTKKKLKVLVVEKGDFFEPQDFLQREHEMIPKIYDTEISQLRISDNINIPTVNSTIMRGSLVGGSSTINHALAFDTPKPVIDDWNKNHNVNFKYKSLKNHLEYLHKLLHINKVPEYQVNRNNALLGVGAKKLGLKGHYGIAPRNTLYCRGCGFCDTGCRYNRKQTPLNVLLPKAAQNDMQLIANCKVTKVLYKQGFKNKTVTGVEAILTDPVTKNEKKVKILANHVFLCANAIGSTRIMLESNIRKKSDKSIGNNFSTHAPFIFYGDFDEPVFAFSGGPPMSYTYGQNETDGSNLIRWKLEGIFNHPMSMAQLVPYQSRDEHFDIMKRYKYIMTTATLIKDDPVGKITKSSIEYKLSDSDRLKAVDAYRTGAKIMFAAGAKRVFSTQTQPIIINNINEVDEKITNNIDFMTTSAHLMGGCCMGENKKDDVVNSKGESHDVKNLYIADSSIFPTSLGVNPNLTVLAMARMIAKNFIDDKI